MGNKKDLFENSGVLRAIMDLALPSVLGQVILVIYNMADTLFVGMTNSDAMITAVTVCMPAFMILSAISNLFGVGAASVIARALGKGNSERARQTTAFAVWGCLAVTAVYCAAVFLFCGWYVDLLGGTDPLVHENAEAYMRCAVAAGGLCTAFAALLSHLLRAFGYSAQAGIGIAVGGILNILLDPLFMFVLLPSGQEALGAAVATALSNICSFGYCAFAIAKNRKQLKFSARPSREMLRDSIPRDVLKVGAAACLMTLFENASYAVLDKLMAAAGTFAQAGLGVAKKINMLAHCFVRGMTQGVLPLIAYNYASGRRGRMKRVVYVSGAISVGIALVCTLICFTCSRPLISLFIHTAGKSLEAGETCLKILCLGAPFSAFAYTVISFFQATGRGGKSLVLALLRKGVVDIPLMFLLDMFIPVYGIVAATPVTDFICSIVAIVLFITFLRKHGRDKMPVPPPETEVCLQNA